VEPRRLELLPPACHTGAMGLKSTVATGLARKCELIRAKLLWRPVFYSLELSVLPFALTVELEQFSKQLEAQKEELRSQQEQWVAIRTYSYVPPRPLEPMTRRRLLRHNAIEAWERMQKTGWRRGPPPCAVTQDFLGFGGFPAISTLISLQMFIHAPNPKFTPLGPSMNS
jgi:hypothetical protein